MQHFTHLKMAVTEALRKVESLQKKNTFKAWTKNKILQI